MKKYSMNFNVLNLHIFIGVQQICRLVNAKRKVNIPVFTIWNSHGRSVPEVISGRSHTSLRVFRALGQFREIVKSPQIMGMNKQKVPKIFISIFYTQIGLFQTQRLCEA